LLGGNRRFMTVMGENRHPRCRWRMALAREQRPFAVVVGCADSRVPPELVFDQGLGDLFVIREAGHVIDEATLASVEYAVGHLHSSLVLVVGHESCGAVQAAITAMGHEDTAEGHLGRLVKRVRTAVEQARKQPGPLLDRAVRANISHAVTQLRASRPLLAGWVAAKRCVLVGAYYTLHTCTVEVAEA
jgi:carbonic anhydrase